VTGGSGKVVDSGPNDHIFVFYSDHGGPGVLGQYWEPTILALMSFTAFILDLQFLKPIRIAVLYAWIQIYVYN
jgi:hypothetical protein